MAEQPAVTTRRREVGSASARSLLLTVLGSDTAAPLVIGG